MDKYVQTNKNFRVLNHIEMESSGFHHILLVLFVGKITKVSVFIAKVYVMGGVSKVICKKIVNQQREVMGEIELDLLLLLLQKGMALHLGPIEFRIICMLWEMAKIWRFLLMWL